MLLILRIPFMKLPFYSFYTFIKKSFDVASDTKLIEQLKEDKVKEALIIKRSWIYGVLISWILVITFILTIVNSFNIYEWIIVDGMHTYIWYTMIAFLIISLYGLITNSLIYLFAFKKNYEHWNVILPVEQLIISLKKGDDLFIDFFNQISTNVFVFYIVLFIYGGFLSYSMITGQDATADELMYSIINMFLIVWQLWLMHHYRRKMFDLEMDYSIFVPGNIYFANQSDMSMTSSVLESVKVSKVEEETVESNIQEYFDLGIIKLYALGSSKVVSLNFIENPKETKENIEIMLHSDWFKLNNLYLKNILNLHNISEKEYDTKETKEIVLSFLATNDKDIQFDYIHGDVVKKSEIENMYNFYKGVINSID